MIADVRTELDLWGTDLLEVPYEAYDSALKFMEYPHNIWPYMVQYLDFGVLKFLLQWTFVSIIAD